MAVTQAYIKNTDFQSFDPNQPEKGAPVWAVYDGTKFKTFAQRGHAMNSFRHAARYRAKLYEFDNGAWVLRAVHDPANWPTRCERCTAPLVRKEQPDDRWSAVHYLGDDDVHVGQLEFIRSQRKISLPVTSMIVCPDCADVMRFA